MSDIAKIARFQELKELGFASISGTYTAIGSPLEFPGRLIKITNLTDAALYISTNGTDDHDVIAANSAFVYDLGGNRSNISGSLDFQRATRFFIKELDTPTEGSVFLTSIHASDN